MQRPESARPTSIREAPERARGEPHAGRVIAVLGMHRSGTSAIARGLQALGVALGDNLMPPISGENDKGFFEDMDIHRLNERLMAKVGTAWDKLAPFERTTIDGPALSAERREAASLLFGKVAGGVFAFKNPRTALLLPFWQCVFDDLELDDRYVIAIRNPIECAVSLQNRNGIHLAKGVALWAKHIIEAIGAVEGRTRVFVAYERLLSNPLHELRRMSSILGLAEPLAESASVREYCDDFLSLSLRHNRIGRKELDRCGQAPAFVIELYDLVTELALADDANVRVDADRLADIVSRYKESAPLLAYADRIEEERIAARSQIEAAAKKTRDIEGALQKATIEQQAAAQERDKVKLDLTRLEREFEQARLAAEAEQKRVMDAARALADVRNDSVRMAAQLAQRAETNERLQTELLAAHEALDAARAAEAAHAAAAEALRTELAKLTHDMAESSDAAREASLASQQKLAAARSAERELAREAAELRGQNAASLQQFRNCRRDLLLARAAVTQMRRSASWRLTAPLRAIGSLARDPVGRARAAASTAVRAAWRRLPMPAERRGKIAAFLFSTAPALFAWSQVYRNWAATRQESETNEGGESIEPAPDPALEG